MDKRITDAEAVLAGRAYTHNTNYSKLREALSALLTLAKSQEAELARLDEQMGMSVTVGGGLSVHGSGDAIRRVQNYIMLDSAHPVEREDVRRSLARDLQKAEATIERQAAALVLKDEALRDLLPGVLCGETWGLPDEEKVAITVTFGAIRKARALTDGSEGGD